MDLKITQEKENPLFNRKEFQFEVQSKVTPSRAEIGKLISEKFSTPIDNIEIKKINGKFGSNSFNIAAFIYKSKEDRMNTESKPKLITGSEQKIEEKPQEIQEPQKTQDKKTESQQSEATNNANADKDEGNNKINKNIDKELSDKDDSERNESKANQNKE